MYPINAPQVEAIYVLLFVVLFFFFILRLFFPLAYVCSLLFCFFLSLLVPCPLLLCQSISCIKHGYRYPTTPPIGSNLFSLMFIFVVFGFFVFFFFVFFFSFVFFVFLFLGFVFFVFVVFLFSLCASLCSLLFCCFGRCRSKAASVWGALSKVRCDM